MGVFALTNTSTRVDQAVSAVHSGLFPNGTGIVYSAGAQTISGVKTFGGGLISRAGFDASGNVSGKLSPHNDGLVDLGAESNRFGTLYATGITGTNAVFGGDVTVVGTLNANLNIGATGLASISVTGTGFFQNARVTGATVLGGATTISGNIGSSGNNTFAGTNTFQNTTSFQDPVFFEDSLTASGVSTIRGATTFHSSVAITGGTLTHNGTASLTGTFTHTGNFYQGGPTSLTGNLSVNGNSTFTGNVTVANGTTIIRSATNFTTGTSASDRLTINQNVDQTGDYNLTGSLRVSSNIFVTGTANVDGVLSVSSTGYFEGVRVTGTTHSNGTNTLTGNNALLGNTFITGNETHSGNATFNNDTGNLIQFNGFIRPKIIASGLGSATVNTSYDGIGDFWAGQAPDALTISSATGRWITQYTGVIGEMGLFLTGSTAAGGNNGLPVGTASFPVYGRPLLLINVGTTLGTPRSGVWFPLGV
jgi:autotransporter-associated beta strand protein